MWTKIKPYVIGIAAALAVGGLSAWATRGQMDIYDDIVTPPLTPPMWLFPVVWSILFILMGISSAMIYKRAPGKLLVYVLQLAVNFLWTIIFFNFREFLFSSVWLGLLWVMILIMIAQFSKVEKKAGLLQVPYLVWVSFALYLNIAIYVLNR